MCFEHFTQSMQQIHILLNIRYMYLNDCTNFFLYYENRNTRNNFVIFNYELFMRWTFFFLSCLLNNLNKLCKQMYFI